LETGELTQDDIDKIHTKVTSILNEEFQASKDYIQKRRDWLSAYWLGFKSPEQLSRVRNTGYGKFKFFFFPRVFIIIYLHHISEILELPHSV
jgi:2-oxoglutarate dehydrogenase complex dehydrogenase (E1) component-like enzyme